MLTGSAAAGHAAAIQPSRAAKLCSLRHVGGVRNRPDEVDAAARYIILGHRWSVSAWFWLSSGRVVGEVERVRP